jgi:hypothetical protein
MITEKVDGTEISTYGLRLASIKGNFDLPRYKNILESNPVTADVRITEEKTVQIKLIGEYATTAAMLTAIGNFKTKLQSAVKLLWAFTNHDFSHYCVIRDGVKIITYKRPMAEIDIKLSITTEL